MADFVSYTGTTFYETISCWTVCFSVVYKDLHCTLNVTYPGLGELTWSNLQLILSSSCSSRVRKSLNCAGSVLEIYCLNDCKDSEIKLDAFQSHITLNK